MLCISKVKYKSGLIQNHVTTSEALHDNFISMLFVSCSDYIECIYTWTIDI